MPTTPSIAAGTPRGISRTLSGFVIETESITPTDLSDPVPDQNGAVADEITYDTRTDLRLTVRSATTGTTAPATVGNTLAYGGATYKVDSCEDAGSYNGLRRWNITGHRFTNYPAAS